MLTPLPIGIGLRYVRARQHQFFVSFISWVSLAGIGLGVAALITILSVMNGFEGELRSRLLALAAHATLPGPADRAALDGLARRASTQPGVVDARPFVQVEGLVSSGPHLAGVTLRGVVVAAEERNELLREAMPPGTLGRLEPGAQRVLLGRALAVQLEAGIGDRVTILLPRTAGDGALEPKIGSFEVAGLFEIGLADHDAVVALAEFGDVAALAGVAAPAGVQLFFADPFDAPRLAPLAGTAAGTEARDWTRDHAAYFHAIRLEKTMMTVILLLIVAVAAFNIVASLVMVVAEKRNDIAILRTLGMAPGGVVGIFLVQGTVIGWAGTLAGVLLGVALAANVGDIAPVLERWLGFQVFDADVYYITRIPSELRAADVGLVGGIALLLTLLATVYPARRAAATEPAEALRYE